MMARNMPFTESIRKIPVRMLLDGVAAFRGLFSGQPGYFWAIFKSHCYFYYWLFFKKNQMPTTKTAMRKMKGYYNGSLLWRHFVEKKQFFSEIVDMKD
jgi:hypothetical protein